MRIKFIQQCIDIIRFKKSSLLRIHLQYFIYRIKINKKIKQIKQKNRIKIAFLHMYSTSIQNISIFEKFLENPRFEPFFIVNPDISRSKENFIYQYNKTFNELAKKYGIEKVLHGYLFDENKYIDYTKNFDIMTTNNPYDSMAHKFFKIEYWIKSQIPVFYINYFYGGRCILTIDNLKLHYLNYLWIWFIENKEVLKLAKKHRIKKDKNLFLSGYPKMDKLEKIDLTKKTNEKIIIIAPHHTILNSNFQLSNFLKYSNLFLKLPKKYPYIKFIFRPHPLLIPNLKKIDIWGEEKTNNYISQLLSHSNVEFSDNGDYLELFQQSDALIHDCGSFMAEYLYLNKPVAFMVNSNKEIFTDFGEQCIQCHYNIYNEEHLYEFIENVVIQNKDYKKYYRSDFTNSEVAINHPYATEKIYNHLLKELT
ncbi:hypothetical protein DR740_00295 [Campylobacter lari]|nr:hypothetical protein [Campylobacter lari]